MPQLPSGRHVGLAAEPAQELAKTGNIQFKVGFYKYVKKPADMGPLICISYYHPGEDDSIPGEPYLSGLMLSDIGADKCDWPEEDIAAFNAWLEQPRTKDFLQTAYNELKHIIETVKVVMPENLKGVMEADEFELVMHLFSEDPDLPDDSPGNKKVPLTPQQQQKPMNEPALRVLNLRKQWQSEGKEPKRREPVKKSQTKSNQESHLMNIFNIFKKKTVPKVEVLPDAFDSIAVMCKFMAIERINPEFYKRHYNAIQMSNTFVRLIATTFPPLEKAFRESLVLPVGSDAAPIRLAFKTLEIPEEKLK